MPGSIRLFVREALCAGAEIAVTPARAHYLRDVMRRGPGDAVHVFDGASGEWRARIATVARDRATLIVGECLREQEPEPELWLVFAALKRDATDWVVQKATELGVSALLPVTTAHTVAGRINLDRVEAIAVEAAEQCERLTVPAIHPLQRLDALLERWPDRVLHAALEREAAPAPAPGNGPAALLIGPEGGWSDVERRTLRSKAFIRPVSLGPRVLRAETAAVAGLALLQARDHG